MNRPFTDIAPTPRPAPPSRLARSVARELAPWVAFGLMLGIAFALIYRASQPPPEPPSVAGAAVSLVEAPAQETANALKATELALLQATATPSPTPRPSEPPSTLTPTINLCGTAAPGSVCQVPYPPLPTATAYPDCTTYLATPANGGDLCRWPTEGP